MTTPQNSNNFTFQVDINVINHLGIGLYSSTPAALTELVSNAWDADAKNVWIVIDAQNDTISIEDDGHGMDANAIKSKFLNVGYARRLASKSNVSAAGQRRVMGRKGIGKLSMFALANYVHVSSKTASDALVGFEVDVRQLKQDLQAHKNIVLNEFQPKPLQSNHGTRIVLTEVLKTLNTAEKHLRTKLARRFSVIGDEHDFHVFINGTEITYNDRDIYGHVQFLWAFDQATLDRIQPLCTKISSIDETGVKEVCAKLLPGTLPLHDGSEVKVTGYIASVFKPGDLGKKEDSANALSVFANGRVFAENILNEANSAKYYQNYLVGELHADFLDDDDTDRATASREAIKRDDPKYRSLLTFTLSSLDKIGDDWDEWRTALGLDPNIGSNAAVTEWLETLEDARDRKVAKRLMTQIQNATIHADEVKNSQGKALIYRGAIIAFEKLRIKKQLEKLSNISDVLGPEFAAIFSALNEVEEAAYADITKQRLEIIRRFKEIKDSPVELEKVAQIYLFDHLWLLDPAWDRVSGRKEMELTLTEYIKTVEPDSTGARLDISYRSSSGRHVVVELKKPSLKNLKFIELLEQARKYRKAVSQYYKDKFPMRTAPGVDIYLLVGTAPIMDESDIETLAKQNTKLITYEQLITDATNAYQSYLDVNLTVGPLEAILGKITDPV